MRDPAAQKDVEKLLREVFKDDYAKKAPPDRVLFAKKLLKQGTDTNDSAATRYFEVRDLIRGQGLHTICEEARCPNIAECWGRGTATSPTPASPWRGS